MAITFGALTRGSGKIYLELHLDERAQRMVEECSQPGARPTPAFDIISRVGGGERVPAQLVATQNSRTMLAVLPVLSVVQRVTVTALDGSCKASQLVLPPVAALASKANTFLKSNFSRTYRNYDMVPRRDEAWVAVREFVPFDAERDMIVGTLETIVEHANWREHARVRVLDEHGRSIGAHAALMERSLEAMRGSYLLRAMFSISVPRDARRFVIAVEFPPAYASSGFVCLEAWRAQQLREGEKHVFFANASTARYHEWFTTRERTRPEALAALAASVAPAAHAEKNREPGGSTKDARPVAPAVCVVTAVDAATNPAELAALVKSVGEQVAVAPALWLAGTMTPALEEALATAQEQLVASDIAAVTCRTVATLEDALAAAGEAPYVLIAQVGTVFEKDCLAELASAGEECPSTSVFYVDDDVITPEGTFEEGRLKPDFDPYLLCERAYLGETLYLATPVAKRLVAAAAKELAHTTPATPAAVLGEVHTTLRKELCAQVGEGAAKEASQEPALIVSHCARVLAHYLAPLTREQGSFARACVEEDPVTPPLTAPAGAVRVVVAHRSSHSTAQLERCLATLTPALQAREGSITVIGEAVAPELAARYPGVAFVAAPAAGTKAAAQAAAHKARLNAVLTQQDAAPAPAAPAPAAVSAAAPAPAAQPAATPQVEVASTWYEALNQALNAGNEPYLLFVDEACSFGGAQWLEALVASVSQPGVAVVGPAIEYPNGLFKSTGVCLPKGDPRNMNYLLSSAFCGYGALERHRRRVSSVSKDCFITTRAVFAQLGGLAPDLSHYYGVHDLCLRAGAAGLVTLYEPAARVTTTRWIDTPLDEPDYRDMRNRALATHAALDAGAFRMRWSQYFATGDGFYGRALAAHLANYQLL